MSTTSTLTLPASRATGPPTAPASSTRPYRNFLTPCLHRLFTNAAFVGLAACYVASVLMSPFSLFWSWFPLGRAGVRASLLFISVLGIFVLRIANLRVASRQALSPAHQFVRSCTSKPAYKALIWYIFSALMFSETYIWSTYVDRDLKIVDTSKPYERPHLNERPIFLRSLFVLLAIYQAIYHMYADLDRVKYFESRQSRKPLDLIRMQAMPVLQHATRTMILVPVPAVFAYTLVLRRTLWTWTFYFAKGVYSLPKHQRPTTFPPFIGNLIFVFLGWGWVLLIIWGVSNAAFDAYLAQAPLDKKARPLSSGSKDPNGTLLNGLKSKKEFVSASAFGELAFIAQNDPVRRQTLFREIDRAGGSTWTQLVVVCLGQLQGMSKRVQDFVNPPPRIPEPPMPEQAPTNVQHLPRIAPPLKEGNVVAGSPPTAHPHVTAFGNFAKSYGNAPGAEAPFSPQARRLVTLAVDRLMTEEQKQQLSESGVVRMLKRYFTDFVKQPYLGTPFRQTFVRRVNSVVFGEVGEGRNNLSQLRDAISALASLVVHASTEDTWGKTSKDVANIIRTYVGTTSTIEDFVLRLEPHWTDVDFQRRELGDVQEVLFALRQGLKSILETYDGYKELGLTFKDKRIARETAGLNVAEADPFLDSNRLASDGVEMRERRRRVGDV